MGKQKLIYLVTAAGSIVAAAIAKQSNESYAFEPSKDADEVDPKEVWDHFNQGKKVPILVHLLQEDLLDDPDQAASHNIAKGIEHYAYDVNDPYQFQSLLNMLNNDPNEIKRLSDLGEAIVYATDKHEDVLDELVEKYKDEDDNEDFEEIKIDDIDPPVDPNASDVDTNPAPAPETPADVVNPTTAPKKIEVPADSVITPPVVNSETNTVNSGTEPVVTSPAPAVDPAPASDTPKTK